MTASTIQVRPSAKKKTGNVNTTFYFSVPNATATTVDTAARDTHTNSTYVISTSSSALKEGQGTFRSKHTVKSDTEECTF